MVSKYEGAKYLIRRKARNPWDCARCHKAIKSGDEYYRETIAPINPGPGSKLQFDSYCLECGPKSALDIR